MFGIDLIALIKPPVTSAFSPLFSPKRAVFRFFFPGDSLLFTAGFLASQELMSLPILIAIFFSAAILGNSAGYVFGRKMAEKLFERED